MAKRLCLDPTAGASSDSAGASSSSASSSSSAPSSSSGAACSTNKHAIGYKSPWEEDYPWLYPVRSSEGDVVGMLCNGCKKHKTKNKYNQTTVWSQVPCVSLRRDSFVVIAKASNTTMCRVKSRLRSQMNNSTLNHCMQIPMEGHPLECFDFDKSVDTWSRLRNRRIL